jgi:hypothetical protein
MMNNLSFCIDSAQHRALDFCGGSMNTGQGYGDGADYGDMLGRGRGSGEQIVHFDNESKVVTVTVTAAGWAVPSSTTVTVAR